MPFKLRLKKSRQYNVVSKSLFVICVELLDSNSIECTLSAESSGRECLDSVCQRLGLQQPEFFGLRYISRHGSPHLRWVELDRPIKKQLDRHARELNLLLRVMYYVSGVTLLQDEMTRYHYFLQLKMDVIEGRMHCDPKQSVLLASYSMQAEFGNHDQERHTAEYLKEFLNLFPKHLIEQGHLESLADAVVCQHAALVGLPQGTAEEYYILAAQQLDGYGQETFIAKDESGAEVIIGVSLSGIVVGYEDTQSSKFYRWKDITNVINHKRTFGIECQVAEETVQFQFPDPQSAKYVWRMCVHQHTFYMQNEQASEQNSGGPVFHSALEEGQLTESREELNNHDTRGSEGGLQWSEPLARVPHTQFASCVDLTTPPDMDKLRALLPSYRPAPDYETAMQHKYRGQQVGLLYSSQPEIRQEGYPDVARVEHTYSTPDLDTIESRVRLLHLYKAPPPYPAGNSTPDLAGSSPDLGAEPIYENVPLPWGRSRASSVQSAPETPPHEPPSPAGGDKKPKRKWGLLGGSKSKSKDSKSNTLTKSKNSSDDVNSDIQHRWSVGLPRLPLSPSISKEAMCQLLERKLVDSQLFFEFEKIPKKKTNAETAIATHPDNSSLNRCSDVLPYEENRVRLTPTKDNRQGYINASHLTATVGEHQRFYIAAQGPLPSTVASFWQMVWEADVYLIVMLTSAGEDASAPYYPGRTDRCVEVGEFQVWRQFSQETGHCITTKLRLYHSGSRRIRGVWHLQYTEWGDQGCPNNVGHFLGFLEELSSVRQHSVSEIPAGHNRNPPVLVHCSAGVGRTGVTVLCDLLLYTLDHNQELDIPRVVASLRHQRMLMVQTVAQYRFVYSLLIHYLKHSRLI